MNQCSEPRAARSAAALFDRLELHSNRKVGWWLRRLGRGEYIKLFFLSRLVDLLALRSPFSVSNQTGRVFFVGIAPQDFFLSQSRICRWGQFQCSRIPPNHFMLSLLRSMQSRLYRRFVMREERPVHHRSIAKLRAAFRGGCVAITIVRWIDRFVQRTQPSFE